MSGLPASVLPLNSEQTQSLQSVVSGLSAPQLQWISGYAAGLAAANSGQPTAMTAASPAAASQQKLTVLYGSQTGNGEAIAESVARDAAARGFATEVVSLADYKPANLKRESLVAFVISTHGEGDPPDDAELFHEFLTSEKAPKLGGLEYAVLALGDSSYVNFCQTGREFDERLKALGAKQLMPLVECDLDYEQSAYAWQQDVLNELPEQLDESVPQLRAVESGSVYGKANPFAAEVLTNQKITGAQSSKDVRHIELSLEGSGLNYEPGDSLAVVAQNPPQLVAEIIDELELDANAQVALHGEQLRLQDALTSRLEVTALNLNFLRAWAALTGSSELHALLDDKVDNDTSQLSAFIDEHQIIDVVRRYPAKVSPVKISANDFASMLRTLSPRSYSIASSYAANPDEVHLTVAKVAYDAFDRRHWGAASSYLADQADVGDSVSVFVERNKRFRLPAENVPVIMIGPGTGVAPFRAFVEERIEQGASGENWLFFGDRNSDSDFLYQLEWQRYLKQGHLQNLDVAFSRDQKNKVYVQDRLRERGAELYRWIEDGAAIYVCGDAQQMAPDVHDALLDIFAEHGGLDADAAEARLKELRASQRYQRDVY